MGLGPKRLVTILAFGLVGWALCDAIIFIGMSVTSLQTALIAHAVGGPIVFATLSWIYFAKFSYTTPIQTAMIFIAIVIFMDFFLVSLVINRSLEMVESILGTWFPFALNFLATYLIGIYIGARSKMTVAT